MVPPQGFRERIRRRGGRCSHPAIRGNRKDDAGFSQAENGTHPEAGSFDGCAWAGFWGRGPHPVGLPAAAGVAVVAEVAMGIAMEITHNPTIAIEAAIGPAARDEDCAGVVARGPHVPDAWARWNGGNDG